MKKVFCKLLILSILLLSINTTIQAAALHNPQGRIGIGYKPERYNAYLKTNISAYDLERIGQIIKQQEHEKKKAKKELNNKIALQKEEHKQQQLLNKQQIRKEELAKKQAAKNKVAQEKAALEARHKAEKEQLKQEKLALIKEQQQKEEELKRKEQKITDAKIIEEQEEKNEEYIKAQAEKEKIKAEKLAQKAKRKEEREQYFKEKFSFLYRAEKNKIENQENIDTNCDTDVEQTDIVDQEQFEKERIEQEKNDIIAEKKAEKARLKQEKIDAKNQEKEAKKLEKQASQKKTVKASFFNKITNNKNTNKDELKTENDKIETVKQVNTKKIPQDLQTKKIVKEISNELTQERAEMLQELSTLWVSAVQKSDTVYFAIMKLSNPNGEEVNKNGIKKILEPIISAAPLVGQAFVNPTLTAGSVIGSNFMGAMMNDSAQKRLAKVNDADLVILARAIDELQEALLLNYMAYKNALKEYELAIKITEQRRKSYEKLNAANSPNVILANTFYAEALDNQYKARQEFLMKRVVLEQMVGAEALNEIEQKKVADKDNNNVESNVKTDNNAKTENSNKAEKNTDKKGTKVE